MCVRTYVVSSPAAASRRGPVEAETSETSEASLIRWRRRTVLTAVPYRISRTYIYRRLHHGADAASGMRACLEVGDDTGMWLYHQRPSLFNTPHTMLHVSLVLRGEGLSPTRNAGGPRLQANSCLVSRITIKLCGQRARLCQCIGIRHGTRVDRRFKDDGVGELGADMARLAGADKGSPAGWTSATRCMLSRTGPETGVFGGRGQGEGMAGFGGGVCQDAVTNETTLRDDGLCFSRRAHLTSI